MPLGKHDLKLTHDGFFDYKTALDMRTNTPYESTIKMETSKVGQYINRAKELRRIGQSQQAVGELVEGLKLGASPKEKNEIHWLLGELSIDIKDYAQAKTYFTQARQSGDFKYQGTLGLAKVSFYTGDTSQCLKLLVEALINLPESDPLSREARSLFSQISPFESVVYISTEPAG
ncbi:MAG: hypothetical protein ACD_73C00391G0001, partial [uncultured bacterium]